VAASTRNVSVITTNYDTLLDEAFDFLYPNMGFIDYHVHFMNYDPYDSIDAFNWWVDPKVPVPIWSDSADPKPIKILKVHGSLNWKYCRSCNQVLLTPWDTEIDLDDGHFIHYKYPEGHLDDSKSSQYRCPFDGAPFQTLIVPPAHNKSFSHPIINLLLEEAAREVRKAKRIVFIGYSFPDADVHLKALFHKNLAEDTKVIVITRSKRSDIERVYLSLSQQARFIWKSFEEAIIDTELMSEILSSSN
jgi:NAD-dependent SIR2 family protein deacetylase